MRTTIVAAAKTNLCAPVWLTMLLIPAAIVVTAAPAAGPLRVHPNNPRYFTDGSRAPDGSLKAVYLTGSHHWNNFQDSAKLGQPLTSRFKEYEAPKPKQHPLGITAFDSGREGSMAALLGSPADWISPQNDGAGGDYQNDPPAADGRKVIISDTDHLWGVGGDRVWVWKSFTRGHHPMYTDPLRKQDWVKSSEAEMEGARRAMGHTRVLAERMNLAAMTPQPALASTRYCLACPGKDYLVYAPRGGDTTVDLTSVAGTITVEWLHPDGGTVTSGAPIQGGASRSLRAPFAGDAVLYLKTQQSEPKPKTTSS